MFRWPKILQRISTWDVVLQVIAILVLLIGGLIVYVSRGK